MDSENVLEGDLETVHCTDLLLFVVPSSSSQSSGSKSMWQVGHTTNSLKGFWAILITD